MTEPMLKIPAAEAQRHFGLYQDKALTQPVAVTRNGRARVVMISIEEYERLKRRDRQVVRTEDAPQDVVDAILAARPPEEAQAFDHEAG
ncbi:type II toxin-antitoxin system Phd/YefM family antitoxin [Humitalea sp. 24SJ18S-53]|uniref:type II toxin-antitoxin system Phd/YefM family antitoxin n=1 Tax=Humitalea sp. 24SJ18S-53 TaxID=3422307 RepID=UPI003D676601